MSKIQFPFPEIGKPFIVRGVEWFEPHWEFGHPSVIFSPVLRLSHNGPIESLLEDFLETLCVDEAPAKVRHESDVREFEARGWSIPGLARRRLAVHYRWRCHLRMRNGKWIYYSKLLKKTAGPA